MAAPRLRKSLGQHHLTSGALCRPLLDFLAPAGRRVVEVGPGGGVLTAELLAAGARVTAWEVDLAWAAELRRRLISHAPRSLGVAASPRPADSHGASARATTAGTRSAAGLARDVPAPAGPAAPPDLSLVVGDALDLPWGRLPLPTLAAGNLPYNIATALLAALLPHHRTVPRAAFLVQREVADRLLARPGDPAYGSLSVLVAAYARAVPLGRVRRGSFRPPPKVEGAFVGFELQPPPLPEPAMPAFLATVRLAFAQRRKTLRNALAAGWGAERTAAALSALALPPEIRAERLGLAELLALHAEGRATPGAER